MKAGQEVLVNAFDSGEWKAYNNKNRVATADLLIGANSIDVTLHPDILIPDANQWLDLRKPQTCHYHKHTMFADGWVLFPHGFILGAVNERFDCDNPLIIWRRKYLFVQEVHGKSTLGRCGLCIHATAGYGDFGFKGAFTLEIFNVTNRPIVIYPYIPVAQIEFNVVESPGFYKGSYGSNDHYNGPVAPELTGKF